MAEPDTGTLIWLVLALGVVVVLGGVLIDWRHLMQRSEDLPLWAFLRRQGVGRDAMTAEIGERAVRLAEMRCAACGSRGTCLARLATDSASPAIDCPNAALFAEKPAPPGRAISAL